MNLIQMKKFPPKNNRELIKTKPINKQQQKINRWKTTKIQTRMMIMNQQIKMMIMMKNHLVIQKMQKKLKKKIRKKKTDLVKTKMMLKMKENEMMLFQRIKSLLVYSVQDIQKKQ